MGGPPEKLPFFFAPKVTYIHYEVLQRGVQHREGVARSRDADVQRRGVERREEVAQRRVQSRGVRDDKSRAAARISDLSAPSFSRLVFSPWSHCTTFF